MSRRAAVPVRAVVLLTATAVVWTMSGCRSADVVADTGTVVSTVGESVPLGLEPAYIVEIDGRLQSHAQRSFPLAPGIHVIRVAPHVAGPTHQVPTQRAMVMHIRNDPLELEVRAGWVYRIALEVLEPPDYTTRTGHWQAVLASSRPAAGAR